jgi:hypothetical protein
VRWRLTFLEFDKAMTVNRNAITNKPEPRIGKAYVIDVEQKPATVTDDQGRPVPEVEREAVLREVTIVTKPRPRRSRGPAAPSAEPAERSEHHVRVGDPMPWLQARLERVYSHDTIDSHTEAKVLQADLAEIREVEGKLCAVVQIWIQMVTTGADDKRIAMEMRGQALVRAEDGALLATVLKGPTQVHMIIMRNTGETVTVDAVGKIRLQTMRQWERRGAP